MNYIKVSFLIIGITLFLFLMYLSPIFKPFPTPSGPFAIGTTVAEFYDFTRKELYSENQSDMRSLVVRFFYPSQVTNTAQEYPYLGTKMPYYQQYISSQYHLPNFLSKWLLRGISTHTFIDTPISLQQKSYPIILFSHGLLGFPSDGYLSLLENLASHGYIIAAIDHPYLNALTIYTDGRIVTSQKLSDRFNAMTSNEQYDFQTKAIEIYKADIAFLINELSKLNDDQASILYHHIDLQRIGVMGSSAGGTAAIEVCRIDKRCKAAIDLDGWYDQVIGKEPIKQPLLLLFGSKSIETTEPTSAYLARKQLTREQYYERETAIEKHKAALCKTPQCTMIIIPNASHNDFGDDILLKWPFRQWDAADAYTSLATINGHILEFLNTYLKTER